MKIPTTPGGGGGGLEFPVTSLTHTQTQTVIHNAMSHSVNICHPAAKTTSLTQSGRFQGSIRSPLISSHLSLFNAECLQLYYLSPPPPARSTRSSAGKKCTLLL